METQNVRQWVLQLSGFVLNQMQSENLITMEDISKQKQAEWLREKASSEPVKERLSTLEQVRFVVYACMTALVEDLRVGISCSDTGDWVG